MPLIRARQKAMSDLPDWAKCCDEKIASLQTTAQSLEVLALPETTIMRGACYRCPFCQKLVPAHKSMRIDGTATAQGYSFDWIAVDCFDFDEGPGCAEK